SSMSTPSTPDTGSFVWDTSETPLHKSSNEIEFDLSTPLTPPLTSDDFKQTYESQVKPIFLPTADHIPTTQITTPDSNSGLKDCQIAGKSPVPDTVALGKLFRDTRDLLQAVGNESTSKFQIQYNPVPSIDFLSIPKSHSNSANITKRESEGTEPQVKTETTKTRSVIADTPRPNSRYKGLQAVLEHITPSEIHARLNDDPKLCVASYVRVPNERCICKVQKQLTSDHKILNTVSSCIEKGDYATLPEYLEQLAEVVLCGNHRKVALLQPKAKSRIAKLRDFIFNLPQASKADLSTFRAWTMALANRGLPLPVDCSAREDSPSVVPPKTNTTAAFSGNTTSNLPGFLPYKPTRMSDLAIAKAVKKMIAKPLTATDMKDGFIYIFWDKGTFGMVKIGRTNDLERRLKEWNRCKSTHSYHKSSRDGDLRKVPHVQRIERLMQIELVNNRKTRACDTCVKTKMHKEWFDVSEAKAVEVFQKWRNWILQEPYAEDDKGQWVIRPEMLETIPENCKLEPEEAQSLRIRPRNVKNRLKR
ncbi:hypothetical protein BU25DRAFT_324402, partial [Macroventuria anomochaeta]